jgi:transketolase
VRAAFSDALVRIARRDPRVLLLTGDHGYALFDAFRQNCPGQYINAGIAEQNMVGMAAGLARSGFRPFVYGLSAFIPVRVVEQIKIDVAHDNLPVILVGDGAGFVYSHLGTSHQSTEDIACTRAIPGLAVFSPGDRFELTLCMDLAYQAKAPVYLRMGKADRGDVHRGPIDAPAGDLLNVVAGGEPGGLAFIATGSLLRTAVKLAETTFPGTAVWSAPSLKPIHVGQVEGICRRSRAIVTLEEHSIYGGLGSLIAELSSASEPRPVLRIGVADRFSAHCGSYEYLLSEHGLDAASIQARISEFVAAL